MKKRRNQFQYSLFPLNIIINFDDKIEKLNNDINNLSNDELSTIGERLKSGSRLYETVIMEDLVSVISSLDLSNNYNHLSKLITLSDDANESEIYSMADDYSREIEEYSLRSLKSIKETVSKYSSSFTEEELASLNGAFQNLNNSAEVQIKILNMFKEVYIDDGSNVIELLSKAKNEYDVGITKIDDLEETFRISRE